MAVLRAVQPRFHAMIRIRPETPADVTAIAAIHRAVFTTDQEARLVDLLRNAGKLLVSLVGLDGHLTVGHIGFSPVTTATGAMGAGLAPLAVLEPHRHQGIGAQLVVEGLQQCQAAGLGWVVVLGEPGYYSRFGFAPAARYGLVDEYCGGDSFQVLELEPGAIPQGGGLVQYAPQFAGLVTPRG